MMGGEYVGDWSCPNCDATVFASKNNCYKCQTLKPARAAAAEAGGGGGGYANTFTASFGRPPPLPPVHFAGRVRCKLLPRRQMADASEPPAAVAAVADVNGQDESQRVRSRRRRAKGNWKQLIKACVRRLHLQLLQRCLNRQDAIGKGLHDKEPELLQVKDLEPCPMPAEAASEGAGEEDLVEAPGPTQTSPDMTGQLLTKSEVAHETMVAAGYIFDDWVFDQKPPVGILPMTEQLDALASDLLRLRREHNVTTEEGQQVTGEARFTLVSWNIQGLGGDEPLNEVILRTEVAMRELLALAPTLICLQEVVPETVETIEGMLGGRYLDVECFDLETVVTWTVRGLVEAHVEAHGHYFTKMFVSQRAIFANGLMVKSVSRFRFPSQQGRDLLFVTLEHKGKRMCVATTHLESGRDRISVHLRRRQLQYSLQKIDAHSVQRTQDLFLLVGDMNLGHLDNSENYCAFGHPHSYRNQKLQNFQFQSMIRITRRLASADAASFMAAGILLYRYSVEYKNLELLMGTGRSGRLSILGGKKTGSAGPVDTAIREFDEETGQVISLSALKSLSSTIANSDVSSDSILTCYYPAGKYVLYLVNVDAVPALRGATSDVTTAFDKFMKCRRLRHKEKATSEFLEMSSLDWVDLNTVLARLSAFGSEASAIRAECGLNEFAALIFKCPALYEQLSNIKRRQGAQFEPGTALRQAANTAASESESTDEDDAALEAEAFFGAGLSIREITQGWEDADLRPTWDAESNKRVLKMLDIKDDEQMRPRDPQNKDKKNRFDRCYFKIRGFLTSEEAAAAKLAWKFCGASLIGTNTNSLLEQSDHELTRSGYVSDHYGLYLEWQVSEKHMVNAKKSLMEQEKQLAREKRRLTKIKERLEMKAKALKDAERKKFLQNCALSI